MPGAGAGPASGGGAAGDHPDRPRPWWLPIVVIMVVCDVVVASLLLFSSTGPDSSATAGPTAPPQATTPDGGLDGQRAANGSAAAEGGSAAGDQPGDPYRGADWIRRENERPGTRDWQIPQDPKTWDAIRGFADVTSVNRGGRFGIYVNSVDRWHVEAYRTGYYGGTGGRLVWTSDEQEPLLQPPATTDPKTLMREAPWTRSLEIEADGEWPPGMYLLKLVAPKGATYIPLVVRDDDSTADLLVQSSVTTWQAYNSWGGATLYAGPGNDGSTRSKVVSFDRPYDGTGSGEFFGREWQFVYFAERLGLDLTYWTDIDLHTQPERVRQHRGFVSLGHDEYYSPAMRTGLEQARDAGVNLAFFGANAIFRKIRLEPSPLGEARREVNYRDAASDPLYGKDNSQVTVSWRAAPSNEPESTLIGNYYECNPVKADMVISDADAWVFAGTGLRNGDKLPNQVGNEYDRVTPEVPTPQNIQVLAHSPVTCKGKKSYADVTYYTADSGAGVFGAGTFWWIPTLDDESCIAAPNSTPRCQTQTIVENVLRAFAAGPAGHTHPSVNNLAKLGIRQPIAPKPRSASGTTNGNGSTGTSVPAVPPAGGVDAGDDD